MNAAKSYKRKCPKRRNGSRCDNESTNGINNEENNDTESFCSKENATSEPCMYCYQVPCVVLQGPQRPRGPASPKNHSRRLKEYRHYYGLLKRLGLWSMQEYLFHKVELGCQVGDIREVMPLCVVENVRSRWPNPQHIPYMGHKRA